FREPQLFATAATRPATTRGVRAHKRLRRNSQSRDNLTADEYPYSTSPLHNSVHQLLSSLPVGTGRWAASSHDGVHQRILHFVDIGPPVDAKTHSLVMKVDQLRHTRPVIGGIQRFTDVLNGIVYRPHHEPATVTLQGGYRASDLLQFGLE